jgi:hypothetical protein
MRRHRGRMCSTWEPYEQPAQLARVRPHLIALVAAPTHAHASTEGRDTSAGPADAAAHGPCADRLVALEGDGAEVPARGPVHGPETRLCAQETGTVRGGPV